MSIHSFLSSGETMVLLVSLNGLYIQIEKMTDVDEPTYYEFITKSTESLATYISNLDPERQSFESF